MVQNQCERNNWKIAFKKNILRAIIFCSCFHRLILAFCSFFHYTLKVPSDFKQQTPGENHLFFTVALMIMRCTLKHWYSSRSHKRQACQNLCRQICDVIFCTHFIRIWLVHIFRCLETKKMLLKRCFLFCCHLIQFIYLRIKP